MMMALKALVVFKVSDKLNWVDPTVTLVVRPRRRVPEVLIGVSQGILEVVTWFSCRTGNLNGARQLTGSAPLFVSLRVILHYGFVCTLRIWLWIGPTRSLTILHHPWGYVAWARWYKMFLILVTDFEGVIGSLSCMKKDLCVLPLMCVYNLA